MAESLHDVHTKATNRAGRGLKARRETNMVDRDLAGNVQDNLYAYGYPDGKYVMI